MYPNAAPLDLAPALHLVAARTATGSVTFFATRHPTDQLIHLGIALIVEERLVIPTPHAERLVHELQAEFDADRVTKWAGRPYFTTDWERVEAAVAEFDTATGKRLRRDGVAVGDRVQVATCIADQQLRQRGEVTAISEKRYLVKLDQPVNDVVAGWYARSLIKPIIRAVCLRDFIAMAMLGVKNGDLPVDKASQIGKLAAQLNDSLYSEAKLATMMTRAGKTPPKLGHLPIGESSVDAAAIKGGQ